MEKTAETALYPGVKAWLEGQGYEVKAEIGAADVMGVRVGSAPVLVELKTGFSLALLRQAVARQALTDQVYVAVPRWTGKSGWQTFKGNIGLCRRLGLGVLSVRVEEGAVQCHCAPAPFRPRKSTAKRARLETEFAARRGDPNLGGTRGPVETAYKQDSLACARHLAQVGPCKGAEVARATGVGRATRIMADNHAGWFLRVARGVYGLTDLGQSAARGG